MNIVPVNTANREVLLEFIAGMGSSSSSFRYFLSRPIDAIDKHIVTLLGLDETGAPISYGHLDRDGDTVWLGICVIEGHTGRGWGKQMMTRLLAEADRAGVALIALSVDLENHAAISLYESCGFQLSGRKGKTCFYRRKTQDR